MVKETFYSSSSSYFSFIEYDDVSPESDSNADSLIAIIWSF